MSSHKADQPGPADQDEAQLPPAWAAHRVTRWTWAEAPGIPNDLPLTRIDATDHLIAETPVALVFNGISHAVMMATPTHLPHMALGFALSEGLIESPDQCLGIEVLPSTSRELPGIEVHLRVSARAEAALKQRRRTLEGRTGCGLCGVDSLAALDLQPPPLMPSPLPTVDWARAALAAMRQLPTRQGLNELTGACHAAGWALPDGTLHAVHEDVGRHNALDKLIGELARENLLGTPGVVVMSSRASVELVLKCARARLGVLATVSAPTSLAVTVADRAGLTLLGFCRDHRAVRYAPSVSP